MKNITYQVITSFGPQKLEMPATEALTTIKQRVNENSLWVYLNGNPVNVETLTIDDLVHAEEIMLTSRIVGG